MDDEQIAEMKKTPIWKMRGTCAHGGDGGGPSTLCTKAENFVGGIDRITSRDVYPLDYIRHQA